MADEDSKKWLSCLGWGCLAVVVISALGIGGCVTFFYKGGSEAHSAANTYLEAVEVGDYEAAFVTLGPDFTERRGLEDFVAFEQAARAEMGSCGDWRMSGTSFNRESARSVALLTFQRMCDEGPVSVAFSLEKMESGWVIQDIRYDEPVVPVVHVCVDCSAVVPPGANFCPLCGTEVGTASDVLEEAETLAEGDDQGMPDLPTPSAGEPE
jgi:hypothetical protein